MQAILQVQLDRFRRIPLFVKLLCLLLLAGIIAWRCCQPRQYHFCARLRIINQFFVTLPTGILTARPDASAGEKKDSLTVALYDWHGKEAWQIHLPLLKPDIKGMASDDMFMKPVNSPDGHIVAFAYPDHNRYLVQAWRDGLEISRITVPDTTGVAGTKMEIIHSSIGLVALDSGQLYFWSTHFPTTRISVIAGSQIIAAGSFTTKQAMPFGGYTCEISTNGHVFSQHFNYDTYCPEDR